MAENIEIKTYSKSALRELYESSQWWNHANNPFTRNRLACYLDNPSSNDEDILWLIAWQNDEIVAYLGLVPDIISDDAGSLRFAWLTSWWADPRVRKTGLADRLRSLCMQQYPFLGIDSGTPWAIRKIRDSGDFWLYNQRPRSFWFLNLNQRALADFGKDYAILRPFVQIGRLMLGVLMRLRLKKWLKNMGESNLSLEYISAPDQETLNLINEFSQIELCVRDARMLTWRTSLLPRMAQLHGVQAKSTSYFGNSGFSVRSYCVKLWKGKDLIGFVNLCISDGYLKFPYLYLKDGYERDLAILIGQLCLGEKIDVIYSQNKLIKETIQHHRFPSWVKKSYPMDILLSNQLKDLRQGRTLQDGDGAF